MRVRVEYVKCILENDLWEKVEAIFAFSSGSGKFSSHSFSEK